MKTECVFVKKNLNKKLPFCSLEKNAFTLIELLVVVAIIATLSSIILVSSEAIRNKTKVTAVKSNLDGLRTAGELWYSNTGSFTNFCVNNDCSCAACSNDWKIICSAVKLHNGNADVTCNVEAQGKAWCASTALPGGGNYCSDSMANAKNAVCVGTVCQ